MDRTQHRPFGTFMYFTPETLSETPQDGYNAIKGNIFGTSSPGFVGERSLDGEIIHTAFVIGGDGISQLWLPTNTLAVINCWDDPQVASQTYSNHIKPALTGSGRPLPEEATGIELIGCLGNPDLSGFGKNAHASIMMWPDLGVDATELYVAIFDQVIGHGQPFPDGTGAHTAWRLGNQVITFDLARSEAEYDSAMHDRIMPEVTAVFDKYGVRGEATIIPARPLGITVREEIRYCKAV